MTTYPYKTFTGKGPSDQPLDYHIDPKDALLVDIAIKLGRPLLVEGEAGCGKTTLAAAIAAELGLGEVIEEPVRSTSRSNDLFYRVDTLARLQDTRSTNAKRLEAAEHIQNYITLEPVGKAVVDGEPRVILIDEIDKADMDFQNDLLFALERFEFRIDEIPASTKTLVNDVTHHMVRRGPAKPIIIFTSNQEKQLPKPFLRRCLYLQLNFPNTPDQLIAIVASNLEKRKREKAPGHEALARLDETIVKRAVDSFLEIRNAADSEAAFKKPATSELLDWVHALHIHPEYVANLAGKTPPLWEMLFRTSQDRDNHGRHVPQAGAEGSKEPT